MAPEEHDDLGWFTASEIRRLTLADCENLSDILGAMEGLPPTPIDGASRGVG